MKRKGIGLILILFIAGIWVSCKSSHKVALWEILSPGGKVVAYVHQLENGQLVYRVESVDGDTSTVVIEDSPLGIVRTDQRFDTLFVVSEDRLKTVGQTYTLSSGKRLKNRNHFNELVLHTKNGNGALLDLVCRIYDDGFALKYVFPEKDSNQYVVKYELTGFDLPEGIAWMQPYDIATAYAPALERNYEREIPVGAALSGGEGWCFPALFKVNDHWVLLSEANLKSNFYGSHLGPNPVNGLYKIEPPLNDEACVYGHAFAVSDLPWEMPWRMILVGDKLGDILESNLAAHLSDPSQIEAPSWIHPGRVFCLLGADYFDNTKDMSEKLREYIDFAHDMSWEYSLIDAGWDDHEGFDLKEMVDYAESRDVKLLLRYKLGGSTNPVDAGSHNKMFDPDIRRQEMKHLSTLGISGVKIDLFYNQNQDFITLCNDILKDAAEFKLLVNFNGCTIPSGWNRTYPNLIGTHCVLGEKGNICNPFDENGVPLNCTILPFTRNIVGPVAYRTVFFDEQRVSHNTSYGFKLALSVVLENGIIHFTDKAEIYEKQPAGVRRFLKDVPAAWDDTRFLSGYPGKDVAVARKSNGNWYIGGINGENRSKQIDVDFSFLEAGKNYSAMVIADGADNESFKIYKKTVSGKSCETINVLPFGGFSIQIKSNNEEHAWCR